MDAIRYPIGAFQAVQHLTEEQRKRCLVSVAEFPERLRNAVAALSKDQLNTSYRPKGWTVQQIIHHLADAGMNAYIRFKRGLTEEEPLAGTFREDLWAELSDYRNTPIEDSLLLIEALHRRFVILLESMEPTSFARTVTSPTHGTMSLDVAIQRFSWHAEHHMAQILSLRNRMGW